MVEIRKRVHVDGVVQGVGFRPFVWRLAHRRGLAGWVENDRAGVTFEVQGDDTAIASLLDEIRLRPPPLAVVHHVNARDVPPEPDGRTGFVIHASGTSAADGPMSVASPADIATCAACLAELRDPTDRRHRYPFINCTDCGPRYTIITGLPYDRPQTTMQAFAMCPDCAAEYADPADRRFHAQPNACPACGPAAWLTAPDDPGGIARDRDAAACRGDRAIDEARERLRSGAVLAVKGLGGFHLVCDATSAAAVNRLRERKRRIAKPLAVMVADLAAARACADIGDQECRLLESRERPIVLARRRADGGGIAAGVAPGNDFLGLMLPYAPLHHLLCDGLPPLVMTSGNLSEEPIVSDNGAAAAQLGPLVDAFLMHDREIHVPCDDSVVRCVRGAVLPIRRSRGYAPLPVRLRRSGRTVLAVGGELKATVCLAAGQRAIMSQHIGDMGNLETLQSLAFVADHLLRLFDAVPEAVACDMHPGYLATQWARRCAADRDIPLVPVQHHEAHVASLAAEHGMDEEPMIGVCFDGTGYGRDGTIWGGEIFVVKDGTFRRAVHLDPFPLPGGDASIRHPWRAALSLLHAAGTAWDHRLAAVQAAGSQAQLLRRQLEQGLNCIATSSMGRLFDAVAALAGVTQSITYEAEAAMNLEALAARADASGAYDLPILAGEPMRIDWRHAVKAVVRDVLAGVGPDDVGGKFHRGVAATIAAACGRLREATGIELVGLTGGVFQNALLVELAVDALHAAGFTVLLHEQVPPNDGGLALGQAVVARR